LDIGNTADTDEYFAAADVGTKGNKGHLVIAIADAGNNFHATGSKVVLEVPATKVVTTLKLRVVLSVVSFG
jgi:hypothetical protein